MKPEDILDELLRLDPGLGIRAYWGERSLFYNPGGRAPLGVIFASVKDRDGENDRSARLGREDVYRFAFGMGRETFLGRFGEIPARPPKGGVVDLPEYDPTRLDELMPHPVYAWMCWVQILSPSVASFAALEPLLGESLELTRARWQRRGLG